MKKGFLIMAFFLTSLCNAQITRNTLDELFKDNLRDELFRCLNTWYNETDYPDSILTNDTVGVRGYKK